MTFFDSIRTVFRKYAEFGGRASRAEFWWFALFNALVSSALNTLNVRTVGPGFYDDGLWTGSTIFVGSSLAGLWSLAVLLPSLAVTVRRLRDAGHRWTQLFWLLLPIAGVIILIVRLCEPSAVPAPVAPPVSAAAE
ncbi:hypothetical protein BH09ACT5_BH09ACT5_01480 [soil metagenome]